MATKKSKHLVILAAHVAGGKTVRAAAAEVGISESTAYGISSSSEFRAAVAGLRTEAVAAAVGALSDSASQAVETLRELLKPEYEPSVRLNAAKAILNTVKPFAEHGELRERLDSMESQTQLRIVQ